jgi:hypothetical protein
LNNFNSIICRRIPLDPSGCFSFRLMLVVVLAGLLCSCATRDRREARYPYQRPLSSPGEKFGGLPPAVQKSVRAQAGAAEMYDIQKLSPNGQVVYEVIFNDPLYPPLFVQSDGSVLNPDMSLAVGATEDRFGAVSGGAGSGVKFGDLPINVAKKIQEKAPTAEVAYINKIARGETTLFEISFKRDVPKMIIAEDGTIVNGVGP